MNEKEKKEFLKYLKKNGYEDTWRYLILTKQNIDTRVFLIEQSFQRLYEIFESPLEGDFQELSIKIRKTQAFQLDLISKIFLLIEDFMWFYHILRKNPKKLSNHIIIPYKVELWQETKYLEKITISQISSDFKFPNLKEFSISVEERKFLKEILRTQARELQSKIKNIIKFRHNYQNVYNTYKHGLAVIPGMFQLIDEKNEEKISSHIYVRSHEKINSKTNKKKTYIYIIPVTKDAVDYYNNLVTDIHSIFVFLIDCYLYFINNQEKAFFPEVWEFTVEKGKSKKLQKLIDKLEFKKITPKVKTYLNIPQKRSEITRRAIRKNFIYRGPDSKTEIKRG